MTPSPDRVQCPFCLSHPRTKSDGKMHAHDRGRPGMRKLCPGAGRTKEEAKQLKADEKLGEWKRDYQRKRRQKVAAVLDEAKSVPCVDCGGSFPAICMDFDHNGSKKTVKLTDWARTVGTSEEAIAKLREEIAKCEVVCANCHRIRHCPKTRDSGPPDSSDASDTVEAPSEVRPEDIF